MKQIIINESQLQFLLEAALSLEDIYNKHYKDKIDVNTFYQIIQSDPTYRTEKSEKMGKFGKWLLFLYLNRRLKTEDLYKAKEYLTYFIKYYNRIEVKDINQYKSLNDLYRVISIFMENPEMSTSKNDEIRKIKEGAEKVYEDERWLVIVPHTKEASCYYGKGTQWCTAAESSHNHFDHYNNQGPLYINIDKLANTKYQFHFESDSFMDETDTPIESPIFENCDLSKGLCEWYKDNVEDANKLFEIWIDFYYHEESDIDYVLIQDEEEDSFYRLYDKSNNENITGGLIFNSVDEMRQANRMLTKQNYCIVPNIKNMYTLLVIDESELYPMLNNAIRIEKIKNHYADDMNEDFFFFDVIYDDNRRCILHNNGVHLYQCVNADMINAIEFITYDNIQIHKVNGFSDILNINYQQVIHDVKNIEVDYEDDDCLYAYNMHGHYVKIDMYNATTEEVDEKNNDCQLHLPEGRCLSKG